MPIQSSTEVKVKTKWNMVIGVYFQPDLKEHHILNNLSMVLNKISSKKTIISLAILLGKQEGGKDIHMPQWKS
jgi:hypothetical protein